MASFFKKDKKPTDTGPKAYRDYLMANIIRDIDTLAGNGWISPMTQQMLNDNLELESANPPGYAPSASSSSFRGPPPGSVGGGGRAIMPPAPGLPPRGVPNAGPKPALPSRNTGKAGSNTVSAIQDFGTGEDGDLEFRFGETISDVEEGIVDELVQGLEYSQNPTFARVDAKIIIDAAYCLNKTDFERQNISCVVVYLALKMPVKGGELSKLANSIPTWAWAIIGAYGLITLLRQLTKKPSDATGFFEWPIVGNMPQLKRPTRRAQFMLEVSLAHGAVSKATVMGNQSIIVSDVSIVKRILQTEQQDWSRGGSSEILFGDIAGGLILQPNGESWKETRKFFDPNFNVPTIKSYTPIVQGRVTKLITWLNTQSKSPDNTVKGPGIELQTVFHGITFDIIVMILLGYDPMSVEKGGESVHVHAWEHCLMSLTRRSPYLKTQYWKYWKTKSVVEYERQYKLLTDLVLDRRRYYETNGVKDSDVDMMASFIRRMKQDPSSIPEFLRTKWKIKVYNEIKDVLGDNTPATYEALDTMPILSAVVKETLRLRPSAPVLNRVTAVDKMYEWKDKDGSTKRHFVAKGADTGFQPYVVQLHPDNYDNPTAFDPSRWLDSRAKTYDTYAYVPFGGGPRKCLGEKLALFEVKMVVVGVLREFDVSLVEGHVCDFITAPTMRMVNGLKVAITKR
ncbi:hypothetical protein SmJEL517_g04267 [Synchytrium microbalum]|uniref:Cytochrome P450 n=1 Tax=Synchytrium microbalum TaxID=1806994 RepID=A0A507C4X6_9FUNG|nr:uncharacterized protein SmJEL517_g04267 [Synchytrium microbalum]TPX32593.1 hypothetical protein SmJEL517_g04267 [Synchytrium microbalum]